MIDLVLIKRDMYETRLLSSCCTVDKVRLVGVWIKRGEVVNGTRGIRSEELREHLYIEE